MGYIWSPQLDQEAKRAFRAVNRVLGVARQMASMDLRLLSNLHTNAFHTIDSKPIQLADPAILGSMWILRKIEVAWTTYRGVTVNRENQVVDWYLRYPRPIPQRKRVSAHGDAYAA